MVRLILALSCFVIFFGNIGLNEASSEVPYWAGHKAKLYAETPFGAHECELTIEYTSDGKHYSASLEIPTSQNAVGGGSCRGLVDKEGNLERKDCTPGQWAPRTLAGTVTKPILESEHASSTSGGCKWADKTLQKKQPSILMRDVAFSIIKEGGKRWLVLYLHGKIAAEANKLYGR